MLGMIKVELKKDFESLAVLLRVESAEDSLVVLETIKVTVLRVVREGAFDKVAKLMIVVLVIIGAEVFGASKSVIMVDSMPVALVVLKWLLFTLKVKSIVFKLILF